MSDLSEKILSIATPYFGPAAKVFLQRQTFAHMKGLNFDDVKKENLQELSRWINISAALIIDKSKAEELAKKVLTIQI